MNIITAAWLGQLVERWSAKQEVRFPASPSLGVLKITEDESATFAMVFKNG